MRLYCVNIQSWVHAPKSRMTAASRAGSSSGPLAWKTWRVFSLGSLCVAAQVVELVSNVEQFAPLDLGMAGGGPVGKTSRVKPWRAVQGVLDGMDDEV